ncbi:hypothetical protein SERLADRAFT_448190 [Serpula lacrymans var. lacrymans S7.9]|uniref:Peroxin/Ferlin domain-containing protein n=1 Tax=Serpula lacrymans var. lacrymans (strain S7.9) TaxID=578457 RepID=F8NUB7_SERL9|nr:uncharacterized protein SERLADRAFT_448190 [Serpula lacrymans var. lacrymans S7.9]EGO25191.1 hypothetical protein SERLADRAFT_448190 [Serpula lacrymans var. lacrymans S7.9]
MLVDFINVVPPALTTELVALAPYIYVARRIAEVVSWKSKWDESWLALAAWWAFCLLSEPMLKHWTHHPSRTRVSHGSRPITEKTLQSILADLTAIHALLPSITFPVSPPAPGVLLRMCLILYPPYLLITYFVPLQVCLGIAGTLVITHRAGWASHTRSSLARSAHLRWSYYRIYSIISGVPLPPPLTPNPPSYYTATSTNRDAADSSVQPSPSLRFLYTIYENQRWWMALDWTAALLPGERPSWCNDTQVPVPPPVVFTLPSTTTAYVSDGHGGRIRRTARWTWEEPEWRVVVRREGQEGAWRVERSPPQERDTDIGEDAAGTAVRMLRAARKRSGSGTAGPSFSGLGGSPERERNTERHADESFLETVEEEEPSTDADGWVYGDNKWESLSNKGGMGKYTRYRRWTRVAVLSEVIEPVGPGEFGVAHGTVDPTSPSTVTSPALSAFSLSPSSIGELENTSPLYEGEGIVEEKREGSEQSHEREPSARAQSPAQSQPQGGGSSGSSNRGTSLRQRLKAAVEGPSH